MPSRSEIHYFGAGPAPLPTPIIEAGAAAFQNYKDKGIGIAEISHRSADANEVLAQTKEALATLLDIPTGDDGYEILFLQGGGSGEFSAVVYNLVSVWVERRRQRIAQELGDNEEQVLERLREEVQKELMLDYLVTGSWSLKASQEAARLVGSEYVNVALDARKVNGGKFGDIPAESEWNLTLSKGKGPGAALTYYCDNETVDGVEFPGFPAVLEPKGDDNPIVVADMSSNFISRRVNVRNYSVIFGGAQKNVGVTGITITIVKKSLLPPHSKHADPALLRKLGLPVGPIVLDWPTIAKNNSLYNTLPIFDVWIAGQVMRRLLDMYGTEKIQGQEKVSGTKAEMIYRVLEKYPDTYHIVPVKAIRSRMNICFRVGGGDDAKEKEFLAGAEKRGLQGLKGHRSVGGIRASNYNAVELEGAQKLVQYLEDFAKGT
ncbi:phosphoserine aminotransferase [Patellaria atrata CBS 101060]|uniref:phosphoserine transaminase n=1 Tax=Patellaria atrata CBS 101060 TaxID=1346257 RepID=A0A9P4VUX4_9PEZI|nr:phosphoserine aminotransferase [Patellaria atrata CBS 101060]